MWSKQPTLLRLSESEQRIHPYALNNLKSCKHLKCEQTDYITSAKAEKHITRMPGSGLARYIFLKFKTVYLSFSACICECDTKTPSLPCLWEKKSAEVSPGLYPQIYSNIYHPCISILILGCTIICSSGWGDPGDGGQWPRLPAGGDQVSLKDQNLPLYL